MKCYRCGSELTTGDTQAGVCNSCINKMGSSDQKPYTCPVCNGQGTVSRPPWVPGDQETWTSSGTEMYECQACKGKGIVWKD